MLLWLYWVWEWLCGLVLRRRVLRVFVDVDEVLSYQVERIHKAAHDAGLGDAPKLTYPKSYTHLNYSELWKVPAKVAHEFVISYLKRNSLKLRLVDGGYENLKGLKDYGKQHGVTVRVYASTSRSVRLGRATKRQLAFHFPGIFCRVILTGNRKPIPPKHSKLYWYKKFRGDVMIDDGIGNVRDCVFGAGGLGVVFGYYDWNGGELPSAGDNPLVLGIHRRGGWPETRKLIQETCFSDAA